MANEQLRRGKPTDRLAEGMEGAAKPDCLNPNGEAGLLEVPLMAWRALQGHCIPPENPFK